MPRQYGSRNKGFDEKKNALLLSLTEYALSSDIRRPSLREFAQNVGVSEPTLRHYFDDRRGVVIAILLDIARRAEVIWALLAEPSDNVEKALQDYFQVSMAGMQHGGFIRSHAFGLIESLADSQVAEVYVSRILEPSLKIISDRIRASAGAVVPEERLPVLALAVFSPLLVVSLHQDLLGPQTLPVMDMNEVMQGLQNLIMPALKEAD